MPLKKFAMFIFFQLIFVIQSFSQFFYNAYVLSAKKDIENNNFINAIPKLNLCIKAQPAASELVFYRGLCKYYLNDNLGAEEDFTNALSIYCPMIFDAYHYRSLTQYRLGEYNGAIADINKIIGKQNGDAQLYAERAFCKLASQNFNGALNDCNKALSMYVASQDLYICKGVAETALNQFDNALLDFNTAGKMNPKNEEVYIRQGITKVKMGNYKEAIENYNQALKIDSASTFAYYSRAEAKIALNDSKGALQDYKMVLQYEPKNALAYFGSAMLEANMKNYKGAIADFDNVLLLNPENIQALFNRANLKRTLNDYRGALADYNKTIELFPYFAEAYYNRSELKRSLKDFTGAKKDEDFGKKISQINYSANGSQRTLDSMALGRLLALDADFSSTDTRSTDTPGFELQPLFYIAPGDSNSKGVTCGNPVLLKAGNENTNSFFWATNELGNKIALTDSSVGILKDNRMKIARQLGNAIRKTEMRLFNDAVKGYDTIIDKNPACAIAYFARGVNYCKEMEMVNQFSDDQFFLVKKVNSKVQDHKYEKYERALSDFSKMIQLEPAFAFSYYNRAYVKCQLQDFDGAVKDYNQAIRLCPDLAGAYYNKAILLYYQKDKLNACENFSKAGELGLAESYELIKKYCHQF